MKKNKNTQPENQTGQAGVNPEEQAQETPEQPAEEQPQEAAAEETAKETKEEAPQEKDAAKEKAAEETAKPDPTEEWRKALETAVKQRDDYLDSLRRTQADFQNFKRRNQTARSDGYMDGTCEVITAMLPVIDNLERALAAAQADDPLTSGVQMTLKMLNESLARFGFEEIPAQGEDFDPEKHNAVMREAGEEPGKVLDVFQKGYRVKDKIIRYAMVKVSVEE